jgi:hypothetical protein
VRRPQGSLTGRAAARLVAGVAALMALGTAVAGCGGGGSGSGGGGGGGRSAAPTVTTSRASATTVSVPTYNPARNARQDVVAGACVDGGSRGWSLSGTVTNPSSAKQGYSIVVDFITIPGDTVVATKLVTVSPIPPKATAHWSATGAAPGAHNLNCVIRQSLST